MRGDRINGRGRWYAASISTLRALDLSLDADDRTVRAAVREAYPFGERAYHPYKVWCQAVKDWQSERAKLRAWTGGKA